MSATIRLTGAGRVRIRGTSSGGSQIVMTSLPRHAGRASLALLAVVLLAGCVRVSSGADPVSTPGGPDATLPPRPTAAATLAPSPTIAPTPTPTPDDGATPVEVTLTDSMEIKPGKMTVEAGKPVRFVITNDGALEHSFFLGSDKEQKQREVGQGAPGPDRYVEVPAAFLQLKPGATVTEGEIIAFCQGAMASFKVPRYVRVVTEWPMSATKVQKFRLRDQLVAEWASTAANR